MKHYEKLIADPEIVAGQCLTVNASGVDEEAAFLDLFEKAGWALQSSCYTCPLSMRMVFQKQ